MKNSILFITLLFFSLLSCARPQTDPKQAFEFYNTINNQLEQYKPIQQKLIDKLTTALIALKEDDNAKIDIQELSDLLEQSRTVCIQEQKIVENLTEFDNGINLKQKALSYIQIFHQSYQNEIPASIRIFSDNEGNKFERAKNVLLPIFRLIKEREIEMNKALGDFENKYENPVHQSE